MMSSLPPTSPLSSALPGPSAAAPAHGGRATHPAHSGFARALDQAKAPPAAEAPAAPRDAMAAATPSERPAPAPLQRRAVPQRETANGAATARGHRLDAKVGEGAAAARWLGARLAAGEAGKPQPLPAVKPDPLPMPADAEGPRSAEAEVPRPAEDSAQRNANEPLRPFAPPDCVAGLAVQIQAQLPPTASQPAAAETPHAPQPVTLVAARPAAPSAAPVQLDFASPMPAQTRVRAATLATALAASGPATAQPRRIGGPMADARPAAATRPATAPAADPLPAALLPAAVLGTPSAVPVEGSSTAKEAPRPALAGPRPAAEVPAASADRTATPGGLDTTTARPREALQVAPEPAMGSTSAAQQTAPLARSPGPARAEAAPAPDAVATSVRSSGPAVSDGDRRTAPAAEAPGDLPQPVAVQAAIARPAQVDGSGAATQARLSARPDSPDFAPQLGAQITTFVRDGIEHAQLHLNPAEMGPVSVQIQLDGQIAQVHLSADHALTRQALEASMPQLASQLSEAGLTLGGGGVFEQPRQGREAPSQGGRGDDGRSGGGADTRPRGIGSVAPVQPPMRRGVVDLVA